jgi:hypothetical protein
VAANRQGALRRADWRVRQPEARGRRSQRRAQPGVLAARRGRRGRRRGGQGGARRHARGAAGAVGRRRRVRRRRRGRARGRGRAPRAVSGAAAARLAQTVIPATQRQRRGAPPLAFAPGTFLIGASHSIRQHRPRTRNCAPSSAAPGAAAAGASAAACAGPGHCPSSAPHLRSFPAELPTFSLNPTAQPLQRRTVLRRPPLRVAPRAPPLRWARARALARAPAPFSTLPALLLNAPTLATPSGCMGRPPPSATYAKQTPICPLITRAPPAHPRPARTELCA